jgi:hypothetical protein
MASKTPLEVVAIAVCVDIARSVVGCDWMGIEGPSASSLYNAQ